MDFIEREQNERDWEGFWATYRSRDPEKRKRYADFLESLTDEEVDSVLQAREMRDEWDEMTDEDIERLIAETEAVDAVETAESIAEYNRYLETIRNPRISTKWSLQRFSLGASWSGESSDSGWCHRVILGLGFFTVKFHFKKWIYRG